MSDGSHWLVERCYMFLQVYRKIKTKFDTEKETLIIKSKKFFAKKISDQKQCYKIIDNEIRIGLHFHVFYTDLIDEIYAHLRNIRHNFTLLITTTTDENSIFLDNFFKNHDHPNYKVIIKVVENRGRDIYPFYQAFCDTFNNYDVIGHFHTKKSFQNEHGNLWRKYLYKNLLGNNCFFDNVISLFSSDKNLGFVVPPPFPNKSTCSAYYHYSMDPTVKKYIEIPLKIFNSELIDSLYNDKHNKDFPCGNMFIARTNAIRHFFSTKLTSTDFPDESGQLSGTLQHYVELMWKYLVDYNGYKYVEIIKK